MSFDWGFEPDPDVSEGKIRTRFRIKSYTKDPAFEHWIVEVWQLKRFGIGHDFWVLSHLVRLENPHFPDWPQVEGVRLSPKHFDNNLGAARKCAEERADLLGRYYEPGTQWTREDFPLTT
jgi:hypothetical protein